MKDYKLNNDVCGLWVCAAKARVFFLAFEVKIEPKMHVFFVKWDFRTYGGWGGVS